MRLFKNANVETLEKSIVSLEKTSKMLVKRDVALRKAYEDLKSLDNEKTEFVSIAAHQLRTPITAARWALTYLKEDQDNLTEKQQGLVSRAEISVERIFQLVEELLELNRMDFGTITLDIANGNIEKLCEDIIQEHEHIQEQQQVSIERNFSHTPKAVKFDSLRLKQVVDNLVDNAIKYSGESSSIIVSTSYDDAQANINVSDYGIGIPAEDQGRMFQKFSRLENAEQVDPDGTGLGLYVGRKIIEAHGGTVSYKPNEPTGSIFTISLPC